jgi:hypothetical protein
MLTQHLLPAPLAALAACLLLALVPSPSRSASDATFEQAKQMVEQAARRLNLTPEQEAKLRPVFEERTRKLKAIRDAAGGDTSRRARMKMFRDARPVQEQFEEQVRAILDASQEAEWEKIRDEFRAKLKAARKSGALPE